MTLITAGRSAHLGRTRGAHIAGTDPARQFRQRSRPPHAGPRRSGPRWGPPDTGVSRSPVVLTRRGRVVLAGLAIVVAVSALGFLGLSAASGAQASRGGPSLAMVHRNLTEVVVRPGDTLWAIAMRAQPAADARIVIQQIVDLNALRGTDIQPGERLWVPRG